MAISRYLSIVVLLALPALASVAGKPTCGLTDTTVRTPPSYDTFTPPAVGTTYVDATYGCPITRLTDSINQTGSQTCSAATCQARMCYALIPPANLNDTLVYEELDGLPAIFLGLGPPGKGNSYGKPSTIAVKQSNFPTTNLTSQCFVLWDSVDPTTFYYTQSNSFMMGKVTGLPGCITTSSCTITSTNLGTNSSYTSISLMDLARTTDGLHFWLGGHSGGAITDAGCANSGQTCDIFETTINAVGGAATTATFASAVITANYWHKLQMALNQRFQVEALGGVNVFTEYNTNGTSYATLLTSHHDFALCPDGVNECTYGSWSSGTAANPCPHENGAAAVQTSNTTAVNCVLEAFIPGTSAYGVPPGFSPATHFSTIANNGWVVISPASYATGACPNSSNPYCEQGAGPTNMADWGLYDGEILYARTDGSVVYRLGFHYSRSAQCYWCLGNGASLSTSGNYIYFNSNYNSCPVGCGSQTTTADQDYTDIYALSLYSNSPAPAPAMLLSKATAEVRP